MQYRCALECTVCSKGLSLTLAARRNRDSIALCPWTLHTPRWVRLVSYTSPWLHGPRSSRRSTCIHRR